MQLTFVSVDIETSGPSPSRHSLLAIGACLADQPAHTFYAELQPDGPDVDPEAVAVSGLSPERLRTEGAEPAAAMSRFAAWVDAAAPPPHRPVFIALNAPFDWMFVADYFHRYVGRNPFGYSALDVKALYMGVSGASWGDATLRHMAARYRLSPELPHHALEDAVAQAAVFRRILAEHAGGSIE
jgi:DNA polymerase III epsilon subunit-like protein